MDRYECLVCGYIYDPEVGDSMGGIPPGVPFEELPADWVCPQCGAGKDQLSTLKQANVGAISLSHIATQFNLKDAQNVSLGEIKASGIYLQETGTVGTIQQIDLTV